MARLERVDVINWVLLWKSALQMAGMRSRRKQRRGGFNRYLLLSGWTIFAP